MLTDDIILIQTSLIREIQNYGKIKMKNPDILDISHPLFDAKVLLQGAQLIHFQPKNSSPLLWSTDLEFYQDGKPFRGGIPICWPWFGKAKEPAHGFARISKWKQSEYSVSADGAYIVLTLDSDMIEVDYWKHKFLLKLKLSLGKKAKIELEIDCDTETTAALHTYLFVENIDRTSVSGLGKTYVDSLDGANVKNDSPEPLRIDKSIDRIYTTSENTTKLLSSDTTILIEHANNSDVVVWNPWDNLSKNISDMRDDAYQQMICIETARITKPLMCESLTVCIQNI